MRKKLFLSVKLITVVFMLLTGGCKTVKVNVNPEIDKEIGKWEANIVRPTGYGTEDRRIVLEVNSNDQCFETTTDPNTGVIYGERNCALEVRSDGNTWIVFDDGKVLRAVFDDEQLVIYGVFPSFGTEPDVKFSRIK
jgi:hypothetical protein